MSGRGNGMRTREILVTLLLAVSLACPVGAQNNDELLTDFFENPDPNRIPGFLKVSHERGLLNDLSSSSPMICFFGGIFHRFPSIVRDITQVANDLELDLAERRLLTTGLWFCSSPDCQSSLKQNPFAIDPGAFAELNRLAPPDLKLLQIRSVGMIDCYWAYFSATGEAFVVQRIVELASAREKHEPMNMTRVPDVALWSLRSYAQRFPAVFAILTRLDLKTDELKLVLKEAAIRGSSLPPNEGGEVRSTAEGS